MNEYLRQLITPSRVLSYAEACIETMDVLLKLKNENFSRVVIPSRGAYPFYSCAIDSLHFYGIKNSEKFKIINYFNEWLMPFTSDWGDSKISLESKNIRMFWSKVLADCIRQKKTPYTDFYESLVDFVDAKYTINITGLKFRNINRLSGDKKFIFIDTAISGRAVSEIIESFVELNLNYFHIIMITDEEGKKLKKAYKNIIEREKRRGRLTQINVEKIFSEDASPLLNSGISSIVFPSLIENLYHNIPEFYRDKCIGAGVWFKDSISHLSGSGTTLNGVRGTLAVMLWSVMRHCVYGDDTFFEQNVNTNVEKMINGLGTLNIFDAKSTKTLVYDRFASQGVQMEEKVSLSSSHVIRVELNQNDIKGLIKKAKKLI